MRTSLRMSCQSSARVGKTKTRQEKHHQMSKLLLKLKQLLLKGLWMRVLTMRKRASLLSRIHATNARRSHLSTKTRWTQSAKTAWCGCSLIDSRTRWCDTFVFRRTIPISLPSQEAQTQWLCYISSIAASKVINHRRKCSLRCTFYSSKSQEASMGLLRSKQPQIAKWSNSSASNMVSLTLSSA